ncbi:MAG: protein kinase [Chloroflexi bacterium]|nr:protein kinase [Chloroflexota bacterium]
MDILSGKTIRGYQLRDRIGSGGFGEVYRAYQKSVDRQVAVKVILPEFAEHPDFVARFEAEARTVAKLEHPHIVPLHDYWHDEEGAFLVMRYLKGGSLRDRLESEGALEPEEVGSVLDQICAALHAAHEGGVIHRDLKPENILLDERGEAYLTDFGIAKDLSAEALTHSGVLTGSVGYLAPEQARAEPITPATDLYSLGILIYELLTGEHPFPDLTPIQVIQRHLNDPLPRVAEIRSELSPEFDDLIQRATAKNPTNRYADAAAIANAFRAAQSSTAQADESDLPAFLHADAEQLAAPVEVFVGRVQELAHLEGLLADALNRRGRAAFVTGEAGSGKSSLLNEFTLRAQATYPDLVVANGICNAHSGIGDPYLPFRELLGMLTGEVEARWAAGTIPREQALRLWRLFPEALEVLVDHGPNLVDTFVQGRALETRAAAFTAEGPPSRAGGPDRGETVGGLNRLQEMLTRRRTQIEGQASDQSNIFEQYTNVLQVLSAHVPLMLIIDNLHWADLSSVGLLFHLGHRIDDHRILIVGAYRPEDVAQGRDGKQHPLESVLSELKRHFGEMWVDLDSGGPTVARDFVDALLDEEPNRLEERFRRELTGITGGHPMFAVELLRDLRERGDLLQDRKGRWVVRSDLMWDELPPRVEGVIERRIGRLDPELGEVLTVASVEGEDFTAEVVARVLGVDERELVRRLSGELDKQHRIVRAQGTRRLDSRRLSLYRFRHHLFQKFIYDGLDPVQRAYQHEAVGSELEALYEGEAEEIAVHLARHFQEAGLTDKAIGYLLQAGERAFRLSANQEAIAHLNKGLDLLKTLPDTPERAQLELALQIALGVAFKVTRGRSAPEVAAAFARARELCEQVGDPSQLFMVLWNLGVATEGWGGWQSTRELADELTSLARQVGEPALFLQALHAHWAISLWTAEISLAYEYTQQGIALYDPQEHHALAFHYAGHDPGVCCLITSAEVLWLLGLPDQALERSQEALNLAEELSHPHSLAFTQTFASQIRVFRRESREARQLAESAISLSAEQGFPDYYGEATIFRGWALAKQGQVEAGIEEMLQGTDPERVLPHDVERPFFLSLLAEVYWQERRSAEGLKILAEALKPTKKGKAHYWDAEIQRLKGEMVLSQGMDQAAVEQHYQRAIELARRQGAKSLELRASMSLSRLLRQKGKRDEARQVLEGIYGWFTEGFDTGDLKEAKELLEALA